jgi:aconitate hydratase
MASNRLDPFEVRTTIQLGADRATVYHLPALERQAAARLDRLPFSIRVLLENALRFAGRGIVTDLHVRHLAAWNPSARLKAKPVHAGPVVLRISPASPAWSTCRHATPWPR